MDAFDAPPLWDNANGKPVTVLGLINGHAWSLISPSSSSSSSATPYAPIRLREALTSLLDRIQSPYVLGGALAAAVMAVGATWFVSSVSSSSSAAVSKVEAENARLFQEIDRLTRDNELLLEGSHRAVKLNAEVQALMVAMQSNEMNPELLQGELQVLMQTLIGLVQRQSAQLQARNEELLAQTRLLREEQLCKICCEYPVARSFNPCGHGTCVKCSSRLNQKPCPFCRTPVESIIPRY